MTALISILAGLKHLPIRGRFLFYTFLGTALWSGVLICLGWMLGAEWMLVKQYVRVIEFALLVAVGIFLFVWCRCRARR